MSKGHDCTVTSADQPTIRTTSRSVEQPSFPTAQQASAATVLRPKTTGDNDFPAPPPSQGKGPGNKVKITRLQLSKQVVKTCHAVSKKILLFIHGH